MACYLISFGKGAGTEYFCYQFCSLQENLFQIGVEVKGEVNKDDFIFVAGRRRIYWAICGPITADPAGEILTCIPEKLKE